MMIKITANLRDLLIIVLDGLLIIRDFVIEHIVLHQPQHNSSSMMIKISASL